MNPYRLYRWCLYWFSSIIIYNPLNWIRYRNIIRDFTIFDVYYSSIYFIYSSLITHYSQKDSLWKFYISLYSLNFTKLYSILYVFSYVMFSNYSCEKSFPKNIYRFYMYGELKGIILLPSYVICMVCFSWSSPWEIYTYFLFILLISLYEFLLF